MINIGYACLAQGAADTQMKSITMRNATSERLREIIAHNLGALMRLVEYNKENNIHLFRISSDLVPFGSSPINTLKWQVEFAHMFEKIGNAIAEANLRVSMHPGQYTVLNSLDSNVVNRSIADLEYHEQVLSLLNTDSTSKLILHVGGVYNDKAAAVERFCSNWSRLSERVRSRIVLENDERFYNISDVLKIAESLGIPAIFDILHHFINPPEENRSSASWILQCSKTWNQKDGRQKIHYSQQSADGRPGAHSKTIYEKEFLQFYKTISDMDLDIMLEVKDKNLSAIKCKLILSDYKRIFPLEREWAKYKYSVLEHSPKAYEILCELLKDKNQFPAVQFYSILEQAMDEPVEISNSINALLKVWEHFKNVADLGEEKKFFSGLEKYKSGTAKIASIKHQLLKLAQKYKELNILESYYFII